MSTTGIDNDARITIHWIHRLDALVSTMYLLFIIVRLYAAGWNKYANCIGMVLIAQISLGISNVLLSLPLAVAVTHNGVAVVLLMSLAALVHYSGLKPSR